MKTKKSLTKRLKVTRSGKILARKPGYNHFNAKQSRVDQLGGRSTKEIFIKNKVKSFVLPFTK